MRSENTPCACATSMRASARCQAPDTSKPHSDATRWRYVADVYTMPHES
jgi:hypothetical protein